MTITADDYSIQRSSDSEFLVESSGVVKVSESAYTWFVQPAAYPAPPNSYWIQDKVTAKYLTDNGKGYTLEHAANSRNSEWTGLSKGPPAAIFNVATARDLTIPYKLGGDDQWTLAEASKHRRPKTGLHSAA